MAFVPVAREGEIPVRSGKAVTVGSEWVAIFHLEDGFHAMRNECPHQYASLAEGSIEGESVFCPVHRWEFNIRTGACRMIHELKMKTYEVRCVDGMIEIEVDPEDGAV